MRPEELRNALWLGALLLTITCSYTLVKTARDSWYLSLLPATTLPFVYVMVGVVTLGTSWLFGLLTQRMSALRSLMLTTLGSAGALFAFSTAFASDRAWLPTVFYVWVNAYGLILVSQFWVFTNSLSNPREAKRIFSIIGGGGILGGLVGGAVATVLGPRVPLGWLVAIGAAMLVLIVPIVGFALGRGHVRDDDEPEPAADAPAPLKIAYVRWLALVALCSVVVTGLLDYQLKTVVQVAYPTAAELARFFGWFYVAMNVVALGFQLIATRWLLQRFGAGATAGVLPIGLAAGVACTLSIPGLVSVLATRLWDQILRFSLNKSSSELFYFPLEAGVRRRAKAFIEAGIERFGDAVAGVLILAAGALLDTTPVTLAGLVGILVVVWLIAWWNLKGGYVEELGRTLRRTTLDSASATQSLRERGALKELVRALDRPYERVVLQAMDLLEEHAERLLLVRLPKLLDHPSARVRARALALVAASPTEEARAQVARLMRDPEPMVRLQALHAHVALGEDGPSRSLDEFLQSDDPHLQEAALTFLVEMAEDADLPAVQRRLAAMLGGSPGDAVRVAVALGARPDPSPLHALLPPLLESAYPAVRCAALRSVGTARIRDRVPELIRALGLRDTEAAARDGLLAFGRYVVGTLGDWLADGRVPIEVRRVIPRVLGDVPSREAIGALLRTRDRDDVILRYRILKASNKIRATDATLPFPADEVTDDIDYDLRSLLQIELHQRSLRAARDASQNFLLLVLRERRTQAFERVFRRLALLYPAEPMYAAYQGLRSENPRVRGNAAEYVESVLLPEHKPRIVPVLPDAPPGARWELARTRYGLTKRSPHASLAALLHDDDPWLRVCALYVIGSRREQSLVGEVESNLESWDARVRETAGWAKLQLVRA